MLNLQTVVSNLVGQLGGFENLIEFGVDPTTILAVSRTSHRTPHQAMRKMRFAITVLGFSMRGKTLLSCLIGMILIPLKLTAKCGKSEFFSTNLSPVLKS